MMHPAFLIIALLIVAGATAAMRLRNLIHCALALTCALGGVGLLYLLLGAQFVGFAQFLVYIGAVSILIVFAILLTHGMDGGGDTLFSRGRALGWGLSLVVFAVLGGAVMSSRMLPEGSTEPLASTPAVRQIGDLLMTRYILPLEIMGLLLTAALIGAVLLAMKSGASAMPHTQPGGKAATQPGRDDQ